MDQARPTTSNVSKPTTSKTGFIKAQPRSMTAVNVVKKAKQSGITMTAQYVYKIRSEMNKGGKAKAASRPKVAKKAAAPKKHVKKPSKARKVNMADFVRKLPRSLTAKEVVAKAAQSGLKVSPDYVWKVRRKTTKKATKKAKPVKVAKRAVARGSAPETAFRRMVLDLGVQTSKKLLTEVEHKLANLIGGK